MRGKHNLLKAFAIAACGAFFLMVISILFFGNDFMKTTNIIVSILIGIMFVCLLAMAILSIFLYFNEEAREGFEQWIKKKEKNGEVRIGRNTPLPHTQIVGVKDKDSILSENESKFKKYLEQHIPHNIEINCKTQLLSALPYRERKKYNHYDHKSELMMHIDFVLITKDTHKVVLAIELQDKSHNTERAKIKDEKKKIAFENANLKLAQIKLEEAYEPKYLKQILVICREKTSQ